MAGERLANQIKKSRVKDSELSDLVYGQVVNIAPLKIQVENRFEISTPFIELSQMVKNLTVTFSVDGKQGTANIFEIWL